MNNNLVGVIVDAGHGGEDPGAVANNIKEKDLNLKSSLYIYNRLKELGVNAMLTRDSDISLPKNERIKKVKSLFNNSPNVVLVSNHINAGGGEGAEIVYALRSSPMLASMAIDNISKAGQISRGIYQRVLPENPSKDYYYIIRETGNVEPILVEYGFIDNQRDSNKLLNNLTDYAEGVVKAIVDYAGIPYYPPGGSVPPTGDTYIVKKGDTLYAIAAKFGLTTDYLKEINDLTSNEIYIGQALKIKQNEEKIYIVKRGDTLYGIATKYKVSVKDLKEVNNLTTNILYIGQELLIPSEVIEELPEEDIPEIDEDDEIVDDPVEDEIIDNESYDIYIVQKGDSLWAISRKYDIPLQDLISINNLDNNNLQIGQQLLVPKQIINEDNFYIVQKGDTLWSIAKKNNTTIDSIKQLNNLTSNLLSVGQQLIIP